MPVHPSFPPRRAGSVRDSLLILVACLAILGVIYQISRLGPQNAPSSREDPSVTRENQRILAEAADKAEQAWNAAAEARRAAEAELTEADLVLLDAAVEARYAQESKTTVAKERLPKLRKLQHNLRGKALREIGLALERQGMDKEAALDNAAAEALYLQAHALEKTIEEKFPESDSRNLSRQVSLESRARVLRAKPIWEKSKAAEDTGDARFAAGDIPGAIAAYDTAWALHTELDRDYRGITPADLPRTRTLSRKRADAYADTLMRSILASTGEAEAKAAALDFDGVAGAHQNADLALGELLKQHPECTYVRADWINPIRQRLLNAAVTRDNLRIENNLTSLDVALRAGDYRTAVGITEGLAREIARVREQFKGSDRPGPETLARAQYLISVRSELGLIHDVVSKKLRALPGHPGLLAWETETTQALYSLVIHGDNPSAVRDGKRPVESLTRAEAEAFCTRLSWILARPVRLPSEAEFRNLAADTAALPADKLAKAVRSIDNCDGSATTTGSMAAGPAGFRDVLGNVAEWIATPGSAKIAGGDAEATLAQLAAIPVREYNATQRSRFVGFRFIVDHR